MSCFVIRTWWYPTLSAMKLRLEWAPGRCRERDGSPTLSAMKLRLEWGTRDRARSVMVFPPQGAMKLRFAWALAERDEE